MITVCDAIMGSGKTEATITYINEHPEKKFIYITPFLEEAARINRGCPNANFVEPTNTKAAYKYTKIGHIELLIQQGRNIATTHVSYSHFTPSILEEVKRQGYTLIIDECVEVMGCYTINREELGIFVNNGLIAVEDNGQYTLTDKGLEYIESGSHLYAHFSDLAAALRQEHVSIRTSKNGKEQIFYWNLLEEIFTSFDDVIILTYMFEGQTLNYYFNIHKLRYERIGVVKHSDGTYHYGGYNVYKPSYVNELKDKINFVGTKRMNKIGDSEFDLSLNWYKKHPAYREQVRKNIDNLFNHLFSGGNKEDRLWSTFKGYEKEISNKRYVKNFLPFNARSTNAYRTATVLAYPVNIYMNGSQKSVLMQQGVDVDEDKYALSIMIQWIWRSAIRDGKEINVYIPSKRMRNLLINWIDEVSNGGEAHCTGVKNVASEKSSVPSTPTEEEMENQPKNHALTTSQLMKMN